MSQPPQQPQPAWNAQPEHTTWGAPPPQAPQQPKKNGPKIALIGCGSILALVVIIGIIGAATGGGNDGAPLSESAAVMCESFVKKNLKSPGTADFPGVTDTDYAKTKTISDTRPWKYKVTGVVDSQNGFGATVRTDYACTVSTKDNDTWTLDDLDMTPR